MRVMKTIEMSVEQDVNGSIPLKDPWIRGLEPYVSYNTCQEEHVPVGVILVAMLKSEDGSTLTFPSVATGEYEIESRGFVEELVGNEVLIAEVEGLLNILKGGAK